MPYFSSLFLKKVLKVRLFCPQRYCTKAVERVRPPLHIFRREHFLPPFFSLLLLSHVPALPPRKCFSLGSDESSSPSIFPFLDCTLPLPIQRRKRGLLPTAQHTLTHFTKNGEKEDPSSSTLLRHPEANFFFPEKLLLPLLNGLLSRKREAEAEGKEQRMVVVYIYFNREGGSPSAFVSCSVCTVPFPPLPITIFLAAPKSTFPSSLSLPLSLREKEMYPSPSPTQP